MVDRVFNDIDDLSSDVIWFVDKHGSKDIAIVGYYDTICYLLNELVRADYDIISCELHDQAYDGYEEAYYMEIVDGNIWCGKMQYEGHDTYIHMENDFTYVEEDFEKEYLKSNPDSLHISFGFTDIYEDEDNSEDDAPCLCFDNDHRGFTFCLNDDGHHIKFKYKGNKTLTMDEAWEIVSENFN